MAEISLSTAIPLILNGLFFAAILYFVGLGLSLVFGVLNFVNLFHGAFLGIGAYVAANLVNDLLPLGSGLTAFFAILIIAPLIVLVFGLLMERTFYRVVYDLDEEYQLLITFGLVLMVEDPIQWIWGARPISLQSTINPYLTFGQVEILGATYPTFNLIAIILFALGAYLPFVLFRRTKLGKIARAVAEDKEMAEALGINISVIEVVVFGFAVLLAGFGGALLIPSASANATLALQYVVLAFAVVVIGGLGSIKGAIGAALLIGMIRSFGVAFIPTFEPAIVFLTMAGVIVILPQGLFGGEGVLG